MTQGIAPPRWRAWMMQGLRRRVVHAVVFEIFAILIVSVAFTATISAEGGQSLVLATLCSLIAMGWNMAYNRMFEAWEATQATRQRSVLRRAVHATGFEGGLVVLLVPLIAWWLGIGWWEALVLDVGLMVFFLVYGYAYNWLFDHLFGLPPRPADRPARP
jgi:uncharacterized membrane protein